MTDFLHRCSRYILIAFFLFLLFPPDYAYEPVTGLDPSYLIAVHLAFQYNLVFGKDIVFPFGPLAILNNRYPIGINRWIYLLFDGYFLVSLVFLLNVIIGKHPGVGSILRPRFGPPFRSRFGPILFLILGILLTPNEPAFQWYFLLFTFYLFYFLKEPSRTFPFAQAGLLSLLCLFYKVNLGISASVVCLTVLHYLVFRHKISLQLIDAYNDAMFIPASHYTLFLIAALLIFLLVFSRWIYLLIAARRKWGEHSDVDEPVIYGITAFLLFILYKSGFVRMDNYHMSHFFHIAGLITAGLYVFSPPGPSRKLDAVFSWVTLGICILTSNTIPGVEHPYLSGDLFRHLSMRKIGDYYRGLKGFDEASAAGQRPAKEFGPEKELKKIIGDHTADIIPTEISEIYFADLRYDPRPVIQSYSAYNTYLDSLNYRKYLSPGAPDYVLFSLNSIDNRYAFSDESRTKMAIFSHYRIAGEAGGMLLLQKKALTPLLREDEEVTKGQLGANIPVDGRYDLQYLKIVVRYNLWGSEQNYQWLENERITAYVKHNEFDRDQRHKKRGKKPYAADKFIFNPATNRYSCPAGKGMKKVGKRIKPNHSGYEQTLTRYRSKNCAGCPLRSQCNPDNEYRIIEVNLNWHRLKQKAQKRLKTKRGIQKRKKRCFDTEPVFASIKHNHQFKRFMLRGIEKVTVETGLLALAHNLRKKIA